MDRFRLGTLGQESISGRRGSSNGTSLFDSEETQAIIRAAPGRMVSLSACTKVCVISFTVGVFVGFTLKRRLRRWISKVLKKINED